MPTGTADAAAQLAERAGGDEAPKPHPLAAAVARAKARSAERANATEQAKAEEAKGTMGLAPAAPTPIARMAEFTEGDPQTLRTTDSTAAGSFTFSGGAAAIAVAAARRLHHIEQLPGDR